MLPCLLRCPPSILTKIFLDKELSKFSCRPHLSLCNSVVSHPHGDAVAEWVRALDWRPGGPGFESHCGDFDLELLAILFTPLCQCLSEETLKSVGPFYLVSIGLYREIAIAIQFNIQHSRIYA